MKVLLKQYLGQNHSWSCVGWGLSNALIKLNHKVDLFPTDNLNHLPANLKQNVIGYFNKDQNKLFGNTPSNDYDLQISYTAMKNFQNYLCHGNKNRIGIWCYEWAGKNSLPMGFAKNYKFCDLIAAPSQFSKEVFMSSGVPEEHIKVLPHGIDKEQYSQTSTLSLSNKKFKILANIAQTHLRKNIPGLLEAYGKAFTKNDDVCLILKSKDKKPVMPFEMSLSSALSSFNKLYPNHAEVKIFSEFVDDISILYRSVDAVFSMTFAEGFYFPGLEGIASGKVSIAPKWGGQLDFLNENNALLVEGKEERADPRSMYWEQKPNAIWFNPSISDAVDKLKYAYHNFETLNKKIELERENVFEKYDWANIANLLVSYTK